MSRDVPSASAARVDSPALVEHFFRHEYSRLVASLTRRFGARHLSLAEDAVQTALERALRSWSLRGVPPNPAAWLHQVAYHHALDVVRRDMRWSTIQQSLPPPSPNDMPAPPIEDDVHDDLLRMIYVCCDPVLSQEQMVALALKTLCGFHTREIARAFLATEANVAKRITRAKERLRAACVDPNALTPADLRARVPDVQAVIYLLFNEGYSSSQPDRVIRDDLCEEAVRLALILAEHPITAGTDTAAFVALLLFHAGRLESRVDSTGALCLLEDQDRAQWDGRLIHEGFRWFALSMHGATLTRYHAEAWIAAQHCRATTYADTDWSSIIEAYDLLLRLAPSPIHHLNRAIAIVQRDGVDAGRAALRSVAPDDVPQSYYLWHATEAEFARRSGDVVAARRSLERARALAPTNAERELLDRRLARLGGHV